MLIILTSVIAYAEYDLVELFIIISSNPINSASLKILNGIFKGFVGIFLKQLYIESVCSF